MPYTDHPPTDETMRIGAWVRARRRDFGLSQRALAGRSGVSQSIISRLENGLAPGLTLIRLARILLVLDWPPREPARSPWFEMVTYAEDDAPSGITHSVNSG